MSPLVLLTYYCLLISAASILGGMIPLWFRLTHRGMELAVSFVAGVMLGIGLLHMLPHALEQARSSATQTSGTELTVMLWVLTGLLTMFFLERFVSHHHPEAPGDADQPPVSASRDHHVGSSNPYAGALAR